MLEGLPDNRADAAVAECGLCLNALVDQLQPESARGTGAAIETPNLERE